LCCIGALEVEWFGAVWQVAGPFGIEEEKLQKK
jgi:hypothetical protein